MKKENNENLPIPSLRNIQSFLQVANCNSINTAAEQLNITPSAVSHQISTLERFIGKKLFIRNGKGVKLTLTGEKYLRDVSGAISEIGRATDQIINEGGKEILRVHSSPTFGLTWLMRRLGYFRDQYPDITLNLTCSYENLQFSRDNIDIDIRHGIADWDAYKVLTIKKDTMIVMASPAYLKQHPVINPEDLLTYELISSTSTLINWDKWFSYHNLSKSHINHSLSFDRSFMSFEAAKMGLGFILESKMLGTDFLREGSLVPVLSEDYAIPVNAHHIVMPHVNERTPKIKAFTDWVRNELQTNGFSI
ncbi:LysR family transcriptional regulator [Pectobacterium brasiliense]|uniref:LysR substrate-binding domain-containing protein n=1 Tax=Pectobacterium brasiliense TaxID=180957 RepID=UPI001969404A|nr:LysR substrate-binding domain-containing protein [Pectobacterium brasiliense]MBN3133195.1 LysR family transcriptional regulator [Pectobacterium brasiliense]